jgi:hypothetical protein
MHHEMNIGKFRMDSLDDIGAMRSSHRDRQRIDLRSSHEIDRLIGVGQKLLAAEFAFRAMSVFLLAAAMFERTQDTKFPFDRRANRMCYLDDLCRYADIVIVRGWRLCIGFERAVHHHR